MERPRLLVFDLDGTLIDSSLDLCNSVNAAMLGVGKSTLPNEVIANYIGDGAAIGDVQPLPLALGILERIARDAGVDTAHQLAALLHGIEGWAVHLSLCRVQSYSGGRDGQGDRKRDPVDEFH